MRSLTYFTNKISYVFGIKRILEIEFGCFTSLQFVPVFVRVGNWDVWPTLKLWIWIQPRVVLLKANSFSPISSQITSMQVYGPWFMVHGSWSMNHVSWFMGFKSPCNDCQYGQLQFRSEHKSEIVSSIRWFEYGAFTFLHYEIIDSDFDTSVSLQESEFLVSVCVMSCVVVGYWRKRTAKFQRSCAFLNYQTDKC